MSLHVCLKSSEGRLGSPSLPAGDPLVSQPVITHISSPFYVKVLFEVNYWGRDWHSVLHKMSALQAEQDEKYKLL